MTQDASPSIRISFCTTCHNRAYQLRQTLEANATVIAGSRQIEWIILNYGSNDDLHPFMTSLLPTLSSRVTYARERTVRPWHMSIAKNLAHQLGTGRLLMSLDCDNFIGDALPVLEAGAAAGWKLVHLWSGIFRDGTCGRIAIARDIFRALGGYDEALFPMSYQDRDLLARARALGIRYHHVPCSPLLAIPNDKNESMRFCAIDGATYEDFDRMNREKSAVNLSANRLVANSERGWTRADCEFIRGGRTD
jgi:hypothetical protein